MAYQNISGPSSQQYYNSHHTITYATPPSYQSDLYNQLPSKDSNPTHYQIQDISDKSKFSSESSHEPDLSDEEILAQATEFTRHTQPPAYTPPTLSKPVAVPQTVSGLGRSFARCWSPALLPYNITETDFVEFIDNLNVVATASPPLQVLDLVGGVLGMVPHHFFQLAGLGVQALAKLGTVAVSRSRTDMYMKRVNEEFFAPRNLKATIVSLDAMAASLRLPGSFGRLAPITDENMNCSMIERRLESMGPYISELRFDVPPPVQQTTVLAKMSAAQVKRQTARAEKKVMKKRRKHVERREEENEKLSEKTGKHQRKFEKEMVKLDKEVWKAEKDAEKDSRKGGRSAEKAERKLREELAKIEDERRKKEREYANDMEDEISSASKETEKDPESKQAMKSLWILIENL